MDRIRAAATGWLMAGGIVVSRKPTACLFGQSSLRITDRLPGSQRWASEPLVCSLQALFHDACGARIAERGSG